MMMDYIIPLSYHAEPTLLLSALLGFLGNWSHFNIFFGLSVPHFKIIS